MSGLSRAHRTTARGYAVAPSTDRVVKARVVPCPTCKAAVGAGCMASTGNPVSTHHSRRRMALRAETETYSALDADYARSCPTRTRRTARRLARLRVSELAALIEAPDYVVRRWEDGSMVPSGPRGAAYGKWLREALAHSP